MPRLGDRPLRFWVLAFSLPMQPAYARVKIWRRLQAVGALALGKNALYVLPARRALLTEFAAILEEARRVKGDAVIFEAKVIAGYRDQQIRALFERERAAEYEALIDEVRALEGAVENSRAENVAGAVAHFARLVAHAQSIETRDFFASPVRKRATAALKALKLSLTGLGGEIAPEGSPNRR